MALLIILLLLLVVLAIYDINSMPRLLIVSALALSFGYSKPVREFRRKNFKSNVKLSWLMIFNVALLIEVLILGIITDFKSSYLPVLFVTASILGVASIVFYFIKYGSKP